MTPLVLVWNCAACLRVVTVELDAIAKDMSVAELMEGFQGQGLQVRQGNPWRLQVFQGDNHSVHPMY